MNVETFMEQLVGVAKNKLESLDNLEMRQAVIGLR